MATCVINKDIKPAPLLFQRGQLILSKMGYVVMCTGASSIRTYEAVILKGVDTAPGAELGKVATFEKSGAERFIGTVTLTED